ncbi:MAG: hypothetical protein GF315_07250 [candidate division Zixibacteria bacterium]|nr:hypothetical protein [candidate division Zixibacteria bacterium]
MLKPSGIITLTTDFGNNDYFVGAVKGVILRINPEARIVDITHTIEPGNMKQAAFTLLNSVFEFPPGTIHYCVVDPGVGSARKPLLAVTEQYYLVAPDNGLIFPLIADTAYRSYEIKPLNQEVQTVSQTFHGRDIFAPAAAEISIGFDYESVYPEYPNIVKYEIPKPRMQGHSVYGEIIHVDRFGNLVTNLRLKELTGFKNPVLELGGHTITDLTGFFQSGKGDEPFMYHGSSGHLEIAVKNKSARDMLGVETGEEIVLRSKNDGR